MNRIKARIIHCDDRKITPEPKFKVDDEVITSDGGWIKTLCWVCRGETKDIQFYPSAPEAIMLPIEEKK